MHKNESAEADAADEREHSSDQKSRNSDKNQNADKQTPKINEAMQSKLAKMENNLSKRSFYHSILH